MSLIELGQATQNLEDTNDALSANDYDFILGSLHCIKGEEDFWKVDYEKNDPFEFFDMYLDQLYELVRWNGFDSLAHLTYPLRYINGEHHFGVELKNYAEKVDEIAERILMLGGTPANKYSDYLKMAQIKEVDGVSKADDALNHILETYGHLIAEERKVLSLASSHNDEVTVAMMSDYLKEQEKMVWMLTAYNG